MKKIIIYVLWLFFICIWCWSVYAFETFRLFTALLPAVIIFNFSGNIRIRNSFIIIFVILWMFLFHYESLRHFFLENLVKRELPKTKFLFPPAGWIMFYQVDDQFGYTEVYGLKNDKALLIDPHEIFRVRTIMYDNIHRNILSGVASKKMGASFCAHLKIRFPDMDNFYVTSVYYPSITKDPYEFYRQIQYQCFRDKP